jgi:co-chaperonin GroES (HSP10)
MNLMGTIFRAVALAALLASTMSLTSSDGVALAQAAAAPAARQLGTVKAISGNNLTLATDAGSQISAAVADGARILQLAPGSTDLKTAQPIALTDIAVGDRVLVTGKSDDDGSFSATRVILMKSTDIAQKNAAEQADWQRRGAGGLVSAVSGSTLTITSGARKIAVETGATTKFRRYGADSIKFEDTKPGTLAQIQAGDQLRVRGNKSDDGLTITAEEVVSGSFKNLAGTIATVNASGSTVSLKDLATKKNVTVTVTSNSDLRKLPPEMAARLAARARGGAPTGSAGAPQGASAGEGRPREASAEGQPPAGGRGPGGPGAPGGPGGRPGGGGDLSQMLSRLPTATLADLKVGDAVMIVASQSEAAGAMTAVTLLSGVEPILAASPSGAPAMTLSPWNMGGGGAADAGSPQ